MANPSGLSVTKLLNKMKFGSEKSGPNPEDLKNPNLGLDYFKTHFNNETIARMKAEAAQKTGNNQ